MHAHSKKRALPILQDAKAAVGNGRAYAVCTCDGAESEKKDKCGFRTEDLSLVAVACDEGYAVAVCPFQQNIQPLPACALACLPCLPA